MRRRPAVVVGAAVERAAAAELAVDTWPDLWSALDALIAPLIAAGWQLTDRFVDTNATYGDSVAYVLERDEVALNVEYFRSGELAASVDESGAAVVELAGDDVDAATVAYASQGWI